MIDPVMNNMAGGPSVDRTLTGGGETLALTSAHVAEEPHGDPTMVESFTPRVGTATQDSKAETSLGGQGRPPNRWGQGIQMRPSKNLPQTSDPSSRPAATPLPISPAEVSEAISRLQREKARIQKDLDRTKAEHADIRRRMDELMKEKDHLASENDRKQQLIKNLVEKRRSSMTTMTTRCYTASDVNVRCASRTVKTV